MRQLGRRRSGLAKARKNGFCELLFSTGNQFHKSAATSAHFAKSGNVGTYDSASGKLSLNYRQTKSFQCRRSQHYFAIAIAPLQFRIRDATFKYDPFGKTSRAYKSVKIGGLRARHSHNNQPRLRRNLLAVNQQCEGAQCQDDVLVAPMLCHAKQESRLIPSGNERRFHRHRTTLDTVIDCDCLWRGPRES